MAQVFWTGAVLAGPQSEARRAEVRIPVRLTWPSSRGPTSPLPQTVAQPKPS